MSLQHPVWPVVTYALVLVLIGTACHDAPVVPEPEPPTIALVDIEQDSVLVVQRRTGTLRARVEDSDGATRADIPVQWSSADTAMATVDGNGVVTARRTGRTRVVAAAGAKSDTAVIVVQIGWVQTAASIGWQHSCGITVDSLLFCWGANNRGQRGDTNPVDQSVPQQVAPSARFLQVALGTLFSCALSATQEVHCWGANDFGQLGDGTRSDRAQPSRIADLAGVSSITAGLQHVCALAGGQLYCWGSNMAQALGRQGVGSDDHEASPLAVQDGYAFSRVIAGVLHTCGVLGSTGYCWGWNEYAQLGTGQRSWGTATPVVVDLGTDVRALGPGYTHGCALTANGTVYCWGTFPGASDAPGVYGTLVLESMTNGWNHLCGIAAGGAAYCWGENIAGQLGDNSVTTRNSPVPVSGGLKFVQIATGLAHTCAVATDGHAYCWGYNEHGQLGSGTVGNDRHLPTQVVEPR